MSIAQPLENKYTDYMGSQIVFNVISTAGPALVWSEANKVPQNLAIAAIAVNVIAEALFDYLLNSEETKKFNGQDVVFISKPWIFAPAKFFIFGAALSIASGDYRRLQHYENILNLYLVKKIEDFFMRVFRDFMWVSDGSAVWSQDLIGTVNHLII